MSKPVGTTFEYWKANKQMPDDRPIGYIFDHHVFKMFQNAIYGMQASVGTTGEYKAAVNEMAKVWGRPIMPTSDNWVNVPWLDTTPATKLMYSATYGKNETEKKENTVKEYKSWQTHSTRTSDGEPFTEGCAIEETVTTYYPAEPSVGTRVRGSMGSEYQRDVNGWWKYVTSYGVPVVRSMATMHTWRELLDNTGNSPYTEIRTLLDIRENETFEYEVKTWWRRGSGGGVSSSYHSTVDQAKVTADLAMREEESQTVEIIRHGEKTQYRWTRNG